MNSQLGDETDEEIFDDPIKLFDSEHDRVHFGSHSIQNDIVISDCGVIAEETSTGDDTQSISSLDSNLDNFRELDCTPLQIKLVDCSKFPWYFKKYTKQILEKINICDLVSDDEDEIVDLINIDDTNDDCLIIDNIAQEMNVPDNSVNIPSVVCTPVALNPALLKRKETIKRKDDIDVQKALSQKCKENLDFKRNKGLVGMTITRKYVTGKNKINEGTRLNNTSINKVKEKHNRNKVPASDVVKVTTTEATPIIKLSDNTTNIKCTKSEELEGCASNILSVRIPVKFSLEKMPEQLVEHVITKKRATKCQNINLIPDKTKSSRQSVKNILNTTKSKKTTLKALESKIVELLSSESNTKGIQLYQDDNKMVDKNVTEELTDQCTEKKNEPNSPILKCTLAKKSRIKNESGKAPEKKHTVYGSNATKDDKITCYLGKSTSIKYNLVENISKTSDKDLKNDIRHKTDTESSEKVLNIPTIPNTNIQSSSNLYVRTTCTAQECLHIGYSCQNNKPLKRDASSNPIQCHYENLKNLVPEANLPKNKADNIPPSCANNVIGSNKVTFVTKRITTSASSAVLTPECELTSNVYQQNSKTLSNSNLTTRSDRSNETIIKLLHNGDPPNSCPSAAIIIRPSQPSKNSNEAQCNYSALNNQGLPRIPFQFRPRFYHNPYKNNYYTSNKHVNQRFFPRIGTCSMPNQFLSPRYKFLHSSQPAHTQTGWLLPNIISRWDPRVECPPNYCQSRMPVSVPHTSAVPMVRKANLPSDSNNNIHSKICIQQDQSTFNRNINEDIPNQKSLDPRRISHAYNDNLIKAIANNATNIEDGDLVTSKTKMLELLDSATNELKRTIDKDENNDENKLAGIFKKPNNSNRSEIPDDRGSHKKIEQQKGYSPPILPIPTFQRVLDHVNFDSQKQNKPDLNNIPEVNVSKEMKCANVSCRKSMSLASKRIDKIRESVHNRNGCNRKDVSKDNDSTRKEELKKISLEEYKKRTLNHRSEDCSNNLFGNFNKKQKMMLNNVVDRRSTESDHGYDSDSTVIL